MARIITFSFLIFLVISIAGCKKSEANNQYYIKYKVESTTIYYGGKLDVQISDENGNVPMVVNQDQNWETTIGPVKSGFKATLKVTKKGWDGITQENHLKINLKIEVSKNNEPFAQKQINLSDIPRATAETTYILE